MGEVILGMPGPWADDNFEAADHYTTKIGGIPDWPFTNSIDLHLLKCNSCKENLCLVAQIYAPISTKILTVEERLIYIFACVSPTCEVKSWRALRVQKCYHDKESETLTTKLQDDPWSFDFDEANDDDIDLDELGKALTEATTLASTSTSTSKTKQHNTYQDVLPKISLRNKAVDDKTQVLPCFYIYTQEENYLKEVVSMSTSISSLNIKEKENDEEAWEDETYEYDKALSVDRTYLKFKKRLDVHPQQCFRYSYGGKALLASKEGGDPGRCTLCGELRQFEMQLMPQMLYYLTNNNNKSSLESWNWITIIVYTCSKGCSKQETDGWVIAEEAIVVQTE